MSNIREKIGEITEFPKHDGMDLQRIVIVGNRELQIENYKGNKIEKNQLVGTGSKIKIINDSQEIIAQYTIVLYGDINGDGKINSVDLLVLQRHILEIQTIEKIFQKAANINKNGKKPTSVDLLLIQRHILGLKIIEQRSSI